MHVDKNAIPWFRALVQVRQPNHPRVLKLGCECKCATHNILHPRLLPVSGEATCAQKGCSQILFVKGLWVVPGLPLVFGNHKGLFC